MTTSPVTAAPGDAAGSYLVRAIDPAVLAGLRSADDAGNPPRLQTAAAGGSPLRCCLRMSAPGERVALVSYAPLRRWARSSGADPGPYDEFGPVFIHPGPCPGPSSPGLPASLLRAPRVFRAYSARGHILGGWPFGLDGAGGGGRAAGGGGPEATVALLGQVYADPEAALVHARTLGFGCFLFEVRRPGEPAA